jgi:hypothetical protein
MMAVAVAVVVVVVVVENDLIKFFKTGTKI